LAGRGRARPLSLEILEDRVVLSHLVADLTGTTLTLQAVPDSSDTSPPDLALETTNGSLQYALSGQPFSPDFVNASGTTFQVQIDTLSDIVFEAVGESQSTLELNTLEAGTGSLTIETPIGDIDVSGDQSTQGGDLTVDAASTASIESSVETRGGNLTINAGTINVGDLDAAQVTTSRPSGGGGPGAISLNAPTIAIGSTATGVAASSLEAGNITLTASASESIKYEGSETVRVTLRNATITGADVTISAVADTFVSFDPSSDPNSTDASLASTILGALADFANQPEFSVCLPTSDAGVELGPGTSIVSSGDVSIGSQAKADAEISLGIGLFALGAYTDSTAKSTLSLDGRSSIRAAGDVSLTSSTQNKTNVSGVEFGPGGIFPADIMCSAAQAQSTCTTTVASGASVSAGRNVDISATNDTSFKVAESGGGEYESAFGLGVVVTLDTTDVEVHVGGDVTASGTVPPTTASPTTGDVTVVADNSLEDDSTNSEELVGDDFWGPITQNPGVKAAIAKYNQKFPGPGILDKAQTYLAGEFDALLEEYPKFDAVVNWFKEPGVLDQIKEALEGNGMGMGVPFADHSNTAIASIDPTGIVKAHGAVQVESTITAPAQIAATSLLQTGTNSNGAREGSSKLATVAFEFGLYHNYSQAYIDDNAVVDGSNGVSVNAQTTIPYHDTYIETPSETGSIVSALKDTLLSKLNGNLGLQEGLFTSWSQAAADGTDDSVAGSVGIVLFGNTSEAYIGKGARINQDVAYRPAPGTGYQQDVSVTSNTSFTTLNLSGLVNFFFDNAIRINPNPFATSGNFAGVGGSALFTGYSDTTEAYIDDGAKVYADDLTVHAETDSRNISIAVAGAKATEYAVPGTASIDLMVNTTSAWIDPAAQVQAARDVAIGAVDDAFDLNVTGGLAEARNEGFGVSAGINVVVRDTEASISPADPSQAGPANVLVGGALDIDAQNTGYILVASLAGAVSSNDVPQAPSTDQPPTNPIESVVGGEATLASYLKEKFDLVQLMKDFVSLAPSDDPSSGIDVAGDAAVNTVADTTKADIDAPAGGTIAVGGDLAVQATNDTGLLSLAGAAVWADGGSSPAFESTNDVGIGGSFSADVILGDTEAYVRGATTATLLLGAASLTVSARRGGFIGSLTAGGSAAPEENGTAVAGSVSVDVILPTTLA
jgi:hypothetical protein